MLRFLDAGESHGKSLVAIIDGFPSNIQIDLSNINLQLSRRQNGYGRGARMKIKNDIVEFLAGVRETSIRFAICMELFRNFNVIIRNRAIRIRKAYDDSIINMNNLDYYTKIENSSVLCYNSHLGDSLGDVKYSYDHYINRITGR